MAASKGKGGIAASHQRSPDANLPKAIPQAEKGLLSSSGPRARKERPQVQCLHQNPSPVQTPRGSFEIQETAECHHRAGMRPALQNCQGGSQGFVRGAEEHWLSQAEQRETQGGNGLPQGHAGGAGQGCCSRRGTYLAARRNRRRSTFWKRRSRDWRRRSRRRRNKPRCWNSKCRRWRNRIANRLPRWERKSRTLHRKPRLHHSRTADRFPCTIFSRRHRQPSMARLPRTLPFRFKPKVKVHPRKPLLFKLLLLQLKMLQLKML